MMRAFLAGLLFMSTGGTAFANLPQSVLASVAAKPPVDAHLPLNLSAPDPNGAVRRIGDILQGRPAFVSFVDYTCNTLCGTDLMLLVDGIGRAGLSPKDYRILVIGIDPKDKAKDALAMERAELPAGLQQNAAFLLPRADVAARATKALGFSYAYDAASDQFAHPAVIYAIGPRGELRAMLTPLALTAGDLRKALVPTPPRLIQRVAALCYGYDPLTGQYDLTVLRLLQLGGALTIATLIFVFVRLARRRSAVG